MERYCCFEQYPFRKPGTRNPEPGTRNPEPGTRNPEPGTRNPEPDLVRLEQKHLLKFLPVLTQLHLSDDDHWNNVD